MKAKRISKNFGDAIRAELAGDEDLARDVAEEFFHAWVAKQVYSVRKAANLSQTALAKLIGTQQSAISRLEDADYDGHSLAILLRIAFALEKELTVAFIDSPAIERAKPQSARINRKPSNAKAGGRSSSARLKGQLTTKP